MKNLNKIKFLKDLIDSDFLIVNSKDRNFIVSSIKLKKNENLGVLNILEVNKNIKQFVRLLQTLKKEEAKSLYIWVENKYSSFFFNKLLQKCCVPLEAKIQTPNFRHSSIHSLLLILDNPAINFTGSINQKFINNNIFLVKKINLKVEKNYFGSYKTFNTLKDFKKIIFISIILRLVISK